MDPPTISVLLPIYNEEFYLLESVKSILNQTYKDFELLLIDDGSNIPTKKLISECAALDSRIRVLTISENGGIIGALNLGLDEAKGKYIARMDSDDVAVVNRFERQIKFLEVNPEIDVIGGAIRVIGDTPEAGNSFSHPTAVGVAHVSMFFFCSLIHPTVFSRKRVFETLRYPSQYPIAEDWALWHKILLSPANHFKFSNLPEPEILNYRRHAHNSSKIHRDTQLNSSMQILIDTLKTISPNISEENLPIVAKVMANTKERLPSTKITELVSATILDIEKFLLSRNFNAKEKEEIKEEITRRLGEFALAGLPLYANPSDSTPWRTWLSSKASKCSCLLSQSPLGPAHRYTPTPNVLSPPWCSSDHRWTTFLIPLNSKEKSTPISTSKVTVICFSKDRAWQLKEYLRSLFRFFEKNVQLEVIVLYKPTPAFEKSYEKVKKMYSSVTWVKETDFTKQLKEIVSTASDFILWGVDDVLYFDKVDLKESVEALHQHPHIISATLRLCPQMDFCHPASSNSKVPKGELVTTPEAGHEASHNPVLKFDRSEGTNDWDYPFELCATLFRKADIISYFSCIETHFGAEGLSHPNKLEVCGSRLFARKLHPHHSKNICTCLSKPVLSVITVNRVQDVCGAPIYTEVSVEELDRYLWEGKEYDIDFYFNNGANVRSCHIGDLVLKSE